MADNERGFSEFSEDIPEEIIKLLDRESELMDLAELHSPVDSLTRSLERCSGENDGAIPSVQDVEYALAEERAQHEKLIELYGVRCVILYLAETRGASQEILEHARQGKDISLDYLSRCKDESIHDLTRNLMLAKKRHVNDPKEKSD